MAFICHVQLPYTPDQQHSACVAPAAKDNETFFEILDNFDSIAFIVPKSHNLFDFL